MSKLKQNIIIFLIIAVYLYINLTSPLVNFKNAVGMPKNLSAKDILNSASFIAMQRENNYNVAETYDFDSRANVLRYPLTFIYGNSILDEKSYAQASAIFVLSELHYDYNNPTPWELKTYMPYKAVLAYKINNDWGVYKLTK